MSSDSVGQPKASQVPLPFDVIPAKALWPAPHGVPNPLTPGVAGRIAPKRLPRTSLAVPGIRRVPIPDRLCELQILALVSLYLDSGLPPCRREGNQLIRSPRRDESWYKEEMRRLGSGSNGMWQRSPRGDWSWFLQPGRPNAD